MCVCGGGGGERGERVLTEERFGFAWCILVVMCVCLFWFCSAHCAAKYGDDSVFFDLDDLENTTGTWDRYGSDDPKRYPDQQSEFFERAAEPLARREIMFTFLGVAGAITAAAYGAVGAKDAKLPITVGPLKPAVVGPRNRL